MEQKQKNCACWKAYLRSVTPPNDVSPPPPPSPPPSPPLRFMSPFFVTKVFVLLSQIYQKVNWRKKHLKNWFFLFFFSSSFLSFSSSFFSSFLSIYPFVDVFIIQIHTHTQTEINREKSMINDLLLSVLCTNFFYKKKNIFFNKP